eukprot:349785-Chlamydomonas_euryale.AAC.13
MSTLGFAQERQGFAQEHLLSCGRRGLTSVQHMRKGGLYTWPGSSRLPACLPRQRLNCPEL